MSVVTELVSVLGMIACAFLAVGLLIAAAVNAFDPYEGSRGKAALFALGAVFFVFGVYIIGQGLSPPLDDGIRFL